MLSMETTRFNIRHGRYDKNYRFQLWKTWKIVWRFLLYGTYDVVYSSTANDEGSVTIDHQHNENCDHNHGDIEHGRLGSVGSNRNSIGNISELGQGDYDGDDFISDEEDSDEDIIEDPNGGHNHSHSHGHGHGHGNCKHDHGQNGDREPLLKPASLSIKMTDR